MTSLDPICTKTRRSWKRSHKESMLKYSCFHLYCKPKFSGCKSDKDEYFILRYNWGCGLNVKYFVVFWELYNFCCRLLPVSGCRLLVPPCLWGGWNVLSETEKHNFIFTFILASLALQECLSFQNNHPLPSSECCVLLWCAHDPAVRTSALPGSPSGHPAAQHLQRLFGDVGGCRLYWPGLRHVPLSSQLLFRHGSCWGCQECGWGFLCLPSFSFLLAGDFQMLFCFLKFVSKKSWRKESNMKRLVLHLYLLAPRHISWKELKNLSPSMPTDFTWKLSRLFYIQNQQLLTFTTGISTHSPSSCMCVWRSAWDTNILPSGESFTDQEEPCNKHTEPKAWATVFFTAQPEGEVISCLQEVCVLLCWRNRASDGLSGKQWIWITARQELGNLNLGQIVRFC